MSYATTASRPNPAAAIGALGVPAAFGALLIFSLAVEAVVIPILPNPEATQVTVEIEPVPDDPTPPDSTVRSDRSQTVEPVPTTRPQTEFNFEFDATDAANITEFPSSGTGLGDIGFIDIGPAPGPTFTPIGAAPAGNPGNWITNDDYEPGWIRRNYSGTAGFTLEIDARGEVSNCTITRSTGHAALDRATCRLLERRAEFSPATDNTGSVTSGTYSSSVNWRIPE